VVSARFYRNPQGTGLCIATCFVRLLAKETVIASSPFTHRKAAVAPVRDLFSGSLIPALELYSATASC
jgi:hypothetical protein